MYTFVFIEMKYGLGISRRDKPVSFSFKLVPEFAIIVDLTIEDNPDCAILIGHGLMPGRGKVYDGKPSVSQPVSSFYMNTFIIRPTVREDPAHLPDQSWVYWFVSVEINLTADSTHLSAFSRGWVTLLLLVLPHLPPQSEFYTLSTFLLPRYSHYPGHILLIIELEEFCKELPLVPLKYVDKNYVNWLQ
jgi:hypothetical protein